MLLAFILSLIIGGLGYWRGSLSRGGWFGAVFVGTTLVGAGDWAWGWLVIIFFITSSALSKWKAERKYGIAADKFSKTDRRDLGQVLANGGVATVCALGFWFMPHAAWWLAAVGALATATADTWATEIGTLNRTPPRLITSWRVVETGTSGAISLLGFGATSAGALLIGVCAYALTRIGWNDGIAADWRMIVAGMIGGIAGSLADSFMGATVQQIRWCPVCQKATEREIHACGTTTQHQRGWHWLDNDWVNAISTAFGALVAVIIGL